jgi:nitrogen fixation NifU-like protein
MLTELAKGKSLDEAKRITNKDVAEALEGLPKNKLHCSNLGADALQMAIKDYEARKSGQPAEEPVRKELHMHKHGEACYCPYCETQLPEGENTCPKCQLNVIQQH